MPTLIIPTSSQHAHYDQVTEIDGRAYLLRFDWSVRRARWMFSIYEADTGAPILLGRTVVDGWPMNLRSRDARLPKGVFLAYDPSGSRQDPGFAELHAAGRTPFFFVPDEG